MVAAVAAAALAACGGSDDSPSDGGSGGAAASGPLAGVCPSTIVFQTDWEPEAEHGGIYALIGDDYTLDTGKRAITGPLMDGDTPTGVDIEIRVGGPAVSYQEPSALMYTDDSILLGFGRMGDIIPLQDTTPVTAILATMEKSPYAIYWDPQTYPDVKTIADLKNTPASILTNGEQSTWINYLVGTGVIDPNKIDESQSNKPATFVAAGGRDAEVGFITAEPFMYEHEVEAWGRPVVGQLIADAGYPEYFQAVIARTPDITAKADCFSKLVPVMQRAIARYIDSPEQTNKLIVDIVQQYDSAWKYGAEAADFAHSEGVRMGVLDNGPGGVIGKFDEARVQKLIDIVRDYGSGDLSVPDGLTPDTVMTNQFIDDSISATTALTQ
ncbi:MAG: hypothetical protein IRZ08_11695 [Frankia sp.]|nr:hypothetical protein [Frankia sp.]